MKTNPAATAIPHPGDLDAHRPNAGLHLTLREQELRSRSSLLSCWQSRLRTLEDETPLELPPGASLSKPLTFHNQVGDET